YYHPILQGLKSGVRSNKKNVENHSVYLQEFTRSQLVSQRLKNCDAGGLRSIPSRMIAQNMNSFWSAYPEVIQGPMNFS
ncbi:hypothetical protein LEMLEM_LOCUS9030, partial [Lemmus lemmus]